MIHLWLAMMFVWAIAGLAVYLFPVLMAAVFFLVAIACGCLAFCIHVNRVRHG